MEPVIAILEAEWASILSLCESLDEAQWSTQTECPGWSVKDNISHLIGIENLLRGAPADPPLADPGPHVRNDIGAFNEAAIAARRDRPGSAVLDEFRAVSRERIDALRELPAEKWDEIGPTPTGPNTYRHFMNMRTFDSWAHEQDIRRALGKPGHLTGPVVDLVLDWHRRNIGYVVGKLAAAPDGSVVEFDIDGPTKQRFAVAVEGRRASIVGDPSHIDTTLTLGTEAYNALLCGRWTSDDAIASGRLRIDGDDALGRQVAAAMAYVF